MRDACDEGWGQRGAEDGGEKAETQQGPFLALPYTSPIAT